MTDFHKQFVDSLELTIDDYIKDTDGYKEAMENQKKLNVWLEKNVAPNAVQELEDLITDSQNATERLWYNQGYANGWTAGVVQGEKIDNPFIIPGRFQEVDEEENNDGPADGHEDQPGEVGEE